MPPWSSPEPDRYQHEAEIAARIAVHEIDQRDERQVEALIAAFLGAAWPTRLTQNQ